MGENLFKVENVSKYFAVSSSFGSVLLKDQARVINGVDLEIKTTETLGLIGESGCGKSTTGRLLLRLLDLTGGRIYFRGEDISKWDSKKVKSFRKEAQIIFQDPFSSLNPRMKIKTILIEPLVVHNIGTHRERMEKVYEVLDAVGLHKNDIFKYPYQFSGGQRQRIAIARALIVDPAFVVCDEAVSALDVSIQSQILNLLKSLQQSSSLTYLFIAHRINAVRYISTRVAVMYLGRIVEIGETSSVLDNPLHHYTRVLLSSIPVHSIAERGKKRLTIKGEPASPLDPPGGCAFHPRCSFAKNICKEEVPVLQGGRDHMVACHNL